ncbi:MAG: peptidase S41 [Kangiella sp.]|nr:MAG: peptidase S41 [Kangiella sp.]
MQKSYQLLFTISLCLFLSNCNNSYLDIFPDLDDPALMERTIAPELLKQDIQAFYQGALDRHPNLDSYANKKELESAVKELQAKISEPMSRLEFYKIVGQLTHYFNDGHSMLIWPYQEYENAKAEGGKPFPFEVKITPQKSVIIDNSYSFQSKKVTIEIPAGSEITAINGISMVVMLETMQRYVGGESQYLREQFLANRFSLYLWSVFSLMNNFEIELSFEQVTNNISIDALQHWEKQESKNNDNEVNDHKNTLEKDFYFKKLKQNVGYLYIGHFDVDIDWFEKFIDNTFEVIKKNNYESLIIDIRDNTGGNTVTATYLASYLATKKFKMISKMTEKLNVDNRGFLNYKGQVGELLESEWDDWVAPVDSDNIYTGQTYLLISPITYSAGIVFATSLKDNKMATLIGRQTGGNANQTAQGNLFNLPNSQLRAYITTRMLVRPSGAATSGGVKPDFEVIPTVTTISAEKDIEIEKALELIHLNSKL